MQGTNGKQTYVCHTGKQYSVAFSTGMIICDNLFFLFEHLSFLKQSLHIPSLAVSHPQCCKEPCFILTHVLRRNGFKFYQLPNYSALPSKINLITLSYALRPIAKLCLLHGQPDLIECLLVLSMRTLFWGARGVITLVGYS